MKIAILDAATLGEDLNLSERFGSLGELTVYPSTAAEETAERICSAEIVVVNKVKMTETVLSCAKQLKLICVAATGFDNVDLQFCRERGIAVCNVPGYSTDSVAQVTVAMALSLSTHLPEYTGYVRDGRYTESGVANCLVPVYHDLAGRSWGIGGYGNIGRKVAAVAEALGCRVMVCRRHPVGGKGEADIDTVCRECDVISLHTPLNESTRNLISRERVALMKRETILINAARGAVTDETAIAEAILAHRIDAFGSDVYTEEPFSANHPFSKILSLPNVCLTPHMAWGSYESRNRCMSVICSNIEVFLAGGRQNRID